MLLGSGNLGAVMWSEMTDSEATVCAHFTELRSSSYGLADSSITLACSAVSRDSLTVLGLSLICPGLAAPLLAHQGLCCPCAAVHVLQSQLSGHVKYIQHGVFWLYPFNPAMSTHLSRLSLSPVYQILPPCHLRDQMPSLTCLIPTLY